MARLASATAAVVIIVAALGPVATARADTPVNLPVSDVTRTQLVAAGAHQKGLSASDFAGLVPGRTYYAYDPDTSTYWAGARLLPSASSYEAHVSDQDAGSYTLFEQSQGQTWVAFNDGPVPGKGCPAPLPGRIIALWNWDLSQCRPALSASGRPTSCPKV